MSDYDQLISRGRELQMGKNHKSYWLKMFKTLIFKEETV